ncbi:Oxidoreductase [Clydaea vesicula]|uniref:Mitochondrial intermembrane space import and assembly protein 40 n=1 Tax=Clydaea vesicula TaxID=447962 RepID=A0AAD5U9F0_9FUNG|nr:Oxidoreductase [Clydaea vesicula]KAJ3397790.1 Oxidoreductase [Lobulomyces angularis]
MPLAVKLSEKDYAYFVTEEEMKEDPNNESQETSNQNSAQQAYNKETGEINWDCPCIAGMTDPPCGDKFKEAFSCFVFSKAEPKGADCIELFRDMQSCFQEHPEKYAKDLRLNDDDDDADIQSKNEQTKN